MAIPARGIQQTLNPFTAIQNLQARGILPTLEQDVPGFNRSFDFTGFSGSVADVERQILAAGGLPVILTEKEPDLSIFQQALQVVGFGAGVIGSSGTSLLKAAATSDSRGGVSLHTGFSPTMRGTNMGLFDEIWGGVQSAASNLFPTNQGIDWNNVLNQGIGLVTTALAPRGVSQGFTPPTAQPAMMAAAPAIARGGAVVARGFFNRFPNLATAIQTLRNSGMNVSRSKLYGVMKRFGPEFLVTGGLLTAAAVNELAVAGPGHRRMNPANVRALRRSVRRIESFHRLCTTTDRLRRPRSRKKC